jgi:hypothetical protein
MNVLSYFEPDIFGKDFYGIPHESATEENIKLAEKECGYVFPETYKEFLRIRNGFNGDIGEMFVRFCSVEKLDEENWLEWKEDYPNFFIIGDDGGLEKYVINFNVSPPAFGLLPSIGDENDFINLGTTWDEFVTHLAKRNFW